MNKVFVLVFSIVLFTSCKQAAKVQNKEEKVVIVPGFNADSAYQYIKNQVDFGPRVPNSPSHKLCAAYLSASLKSFGANVIEQKAELKAYNGIILKSTNIIGSYNIESKTRILLCAHWDSRPISDHDSNPQNFDKPVLGANDGASGVGVLLEMARVFGKNTPSVGIDIVFFDAEDYGAPENFVGVSENSWCLGSQYWSANPHVSGYAAKYGILLDMVGAPNATFYKEQISMSYAPDVVNNVWSTARNLGFSQYFINENGGGITDDHLYVNKIAGIPCIDIIHFNPNSEHGFGDFWHTVNDTMDNIDKNTLFAVGTTLMNVVYKE